MEERKYAIYSRKSKFTGTGESTKNQIELCISILKNKFINIKNDDILIYEDEGFSGYNINRPNFQRLLNDIKENKIKILIFYKLDRISRNVKDFAKLMNLFDEHDLTFISATENIETITPSGKAMTYMISVFAELERNTIAERIKDNMLNMAKSGIWLGGITPTGYKSTPATYKNNNGKLIKYYYLKQDKNIKKIELIFDYFYKLKSLTKLETYLLNQNIYSKNNIPYTRFSLKNILTNPVYVITDKKILDYYKSKHAQVFYNEFNKNCGLMVYNKTENKHSSVKKKDISKWIVAVGQHKGIITSHKFLKIQDILEYNHNMRYRKLNNSPSILSGLVKCFNCNSNMRPKVRSNKKNGIIFDYLCELKEKSKKSKCSNNNINGSILDDTIISHIMNLNINTSQITKRLKSRLKTPKNSEIEEIQKEYHKNELQINDLIEKIKYLDISIIPKINKEIRKLEEENKLLLKKISKLKEKNKIDPHIVLDSYKSYFNKLDEKMKKQLIHQLIKEIKVNKNIIYITYN